MQPKTNNFELFSHLSGLSVFDRSSTFWTPRSFSNGTSPWKCCLPWSPLRCGCWHILGNSFLGDVFIGWMSVVPGGVLEINFVSSKNFYQGHGGKRQPFAKISTTIAAVFFFKVSKKITPGTLGKIKWSNLTHIFVLRGWFNHQLATDFVDGIVGPVLWVWSLQITPRKTNMAAENWSLQKEIPNLEFPSILESSQ